MYVCNSYIYIYIFKTYSLKCTKSLNCYSYILYFSFHLVFTVTRNIGCFIFLGIQKKIVLLFIFCNTEYNCFFIIFLKIFLWNLLVVLCHLRQNLYNTIMCICICMSVYMYIRAYTYSVRLIYLYLNNAEMLSSVNTTWQIRIQKLYN